MIQERMTSQQKYIDTLLCDIEKRVTKLNVTFDSTQQRADALEQRLNEYLGRIDKETLLVACLESLRATESRYVSMFLHALRTYLVAISDFVHETDPRRERWTNGEMKSLLLQDGAVTCESLQQRLCEHFEILPSDMVVLSVVAELVGWVQGAEQGGRRSHRTVLTSRELADILSVIDDAVSETDVASLLKRAVKWHWQHHESDVHSAIGLENPVNQDNNIPDDHLLNSIDNNIHEYLSTHREHRVQHSDDQERYNSNDQGQHTPRNYSPRTPRNSSPGTRGSYSPRTQLRHTPRPTGNEGERTPREQGSRTPRTPRDDLDLVDSPREWRFSCDDQSSPRGHVLPS